MTSRLRTTYYARWHTILMGSAFSGGVLAGLFACSSPDVSSPPVLDPGATFWAVTLQSRAITMSTGPGYDTFQLVATPRSALGTPLAGAPAVTFFTTDSSVRVSPTGLLTARAVRSNVRVIADLTYQGVHRADTAVITVTDPAAVPPHPAAQLVLLPLVGQDTVFPAPSYLSNFYGVQAFRQLQVQVLDSSGAVIPQALLALSTSAVPGAATFQQSVMTNGTARLNFNSDIIRPGKVRVYGSATVYGVTVYDTLTFVLTNPLMEYLAITGTTVTGSTPGSTQRLYTANPGGPVPLGVGGTVWWVNLTTDSLDVVFDDPTGVAADGIFDTGGGDIAPFVGCSTVGQCDNVRARSFPQAGTFPWHSPKTGVSGIVVVQ